MPADTDKSVISPSRNRMKGNTSATTPKQKNTRHVIALWNDTGIVNTTHNKHKSN